MNLLYSLCICLWMLVYNPSLLVNGITCRSCKETDNPYRCFDTLDCGPEEICYTRQFTDPRGYQGFRMGCEDRKTCDLLLNAKSLFGKRDTTDVNSPPTDECYECCTSNVCNAGLCRGSVGGQSQVVTTARPGCPENFVGFKDRCYLFGMGVLHRQTALNYCRKFGADLVSLNSQVEHQFLTNRLNQYNDTYLQGFWTSGVFSRSTKKWEWGDGTPFTYAPWSNGKAPMVHPDTWSSYAVMLNPAHYAFRRNPNSIEESFTSTDERGILCEKGLS